MAATQADRANLIQQTLYQKRLLGEIGAYAKYILTEDPATPEHKYRLEWARKAVVSPDSYMGQLLVLVSLDSALQANSPIDMAQISDAAFTGAVQTAINQTFLA
jgi:hypothetical protein